VGLKEKRGFFKTFLSQFVLLCRRAEAAAPAVVKYEQFEEGLRSQQLLKSEPQLASSFTEYKTERDEEEEEDREREEERERMEDKEEEQTGQEEQDSGLRIKTELLGADYAQIPSVCSPPPPPPPVASPQSGDGITENDTQLNIKSEQLQAPGQTDFTIEVFFKLYMY
jgi:hypothetical protein